MGPALAIIVLALLAGGVALVRIGIKRRFELQRKQDHALAAGLIELSKEEAGPDFYAEISAAIANGEDPVEAIERILGTYNTRSSTTKEPAP